MKRLLCVVAAAALLVLPSVAEAQSCGYAMAPVRFLRAVPAASCVQTVQMAVQPACGSALAVRPVRGLLGCARQGLFGRFRARRAARLSAASYLAVGREGYRYVAPACRAAIVEPSCAGAGQQARADGVLGDDDIPPAPRPDRSLFDDTPPVPSLSPLLASDGKDTADTRPDFSVL